MRYHTKFISSAVVVVLSGATFFAASAASAEVPDTVDQAIVAAVLETLGTEPLSDALAAELAAGIDVATDAGILDQTIMDAIAQDVLPTEGSDVVDESNGGAALVTDETQKLLDAHLDGDQQQWDDIAPEWLRAFESIRADFETCRADGTETSVCARTMGFSLQIAHAEAILAELDARTVAVADLPEGEQADALAAIESERAAVEASLIRSQERLAQVSAVDPADPMNTHGATHAAVLDVVLARTRELATVMRGAQQASAPGQTQSGVDAGQPSATVPANPLKPANASPRPDPAASGTPSAEPSRGKPDGVGASKNTGDGKSDSR